MYFPRPKRLQRLFGLTAPRDSWVSIRSGVEDIYRRLARMQSGPCRALDTTAAMGAMRKQLDSLFIRYNLLWNSPARPGFGQDDPIRIRLNIEDLYRRLHGLTLLPDCGSTTPTNNTFDCVDGVCAAVASGAYSTYQACVDVGCSPPPPPPPPPGPYDCVSGVCTASAGGPYATFADCEAECGLDTRYDCVSGLCVEAAGGAYTSFAACNSACASFARACSEFGRCAPATGGAFTDPCCGAMNGLPSSVTVTISGLTDDPGSNCGGPWSNNNGSYTLIRQSFGSCSVNYTYNFPDPCSNFGFSLSSGDPLEGCATNTWSLTLNMGYFCNAGCIGTSGGATKTGDSTWPSMFGSYTGAPSFGPSTPTVSVSP
jgi:hypothetical protein